MTNTAHILVIDDDTRLRDLLAQYLGGEGYDVATAQDAEDARKKLQGASYDLLVMDIMMPGDDGMALTRELRKESTVPILMLTAMGEPEDRIEGLESGADDYLTKPFEPRELCLRIEKILDRGKTHTENNDITFGHFTFDSKTGDLLKEGVAVKLTSTEAKLLTVLANHLDDPISREDIARESHGISERSVDVQVTRLRKKIEDDPKNPYYLKTHRGEGYVLRSRS